VLFDPLAILVFVSYCFCFVLFVLVFYVVVQFWAGIRLDHFFGGLASFNPIGGDAGGGGGDGDAWVVVVMRGGDAVVVVI